MGEHHPDSQRPEWGPMIYASYIPLLRRTAKKLGYCLALHGSLRRDCDLCAIPWTNDASSPEELIDALTDACNGMPDGKGWAVKPHGRLAWSIIIGGGLYFDISIMPRVAPPEIDYSI